MCQGIGCCLLSWSVTALPLILGLGPWSLDFGSCDVSSFAQTALGDPQMPVPVHFFSLNTLISMSFQLPYADTAYIHIHIYVFLCSFHVLQYAWNHLYHNHTPETLKLYFKKAQWHTGLKRIPHWMLQSHIPVSKQVWIHTKNTENQYTIDALALSTHSDITWHLLLRPLSDRSH